MLACRGVANPPKDYYVPPNPTTTLCQTCGEHIFNRAAYEALETARNNGKSTAILSRVVRASQLYTGMLENCRWCCLLGNSVLTGAQRGVAWYNERNFKLNIPWYRRKTTINRSWDIAKLSATKDISAITETSDTSSTEWETESEASDLNPMYQTDSSSSIRTDSRDSIAFETLNCRAKVHMEIEFTGFREFKGFHTLAIRFKATPTANCPRPWLFIAYHGDVTLWLELMSPQGGIFSPSWKGLPAASDDWYVSVQSWLSKCENGHRCYTSNTFQPLRLIDVTLMGKPLLVLCNAETAQQPYVTLSYVWGLKQEYVLTKDALDGMLHDGLEILRLPQTILDAMDVTRKLGFRYLWVDALCIMQDSPEDKAQQLPMMGQIYHHGTLNISAASSATAQDGFLRPASALEFKVQPFGIDMGHMQSSSPHRTMVWFGVRRQSKVIEPIETRGWTLQEWYMAPRQLKFSSRGLQWFCEAAMIDPSSGPGEDYQPSRVIFSNGIMQEHRENHKWDYVFHGRETDASLNSSSISLEWQSSKDSISSLSCNGGNYSRHKGAELSVRWLEIRSEYARRALTFAGDRLPAISAVAAAVATSNEMTYIAGLWKENLIEDLQWYCIFNSDAQGELPMVGSDSELVAASTDYVAPSWSWASVKLGNWKLYPEEEDDGCASPWHCTVVNSHVELVEGSDFIYGAVRSGHIEIKGKVIALEWTVWTDADEVVSTKEVTYDTADTDDSEDSYDSASTDPPEGLVQDRSFWNLNKLAIHDSPRKLDTAALGVAHLDFPASRLHPETKLCFLVLSKECDSHTEDYELIFTGLLLLGNAQRSRRIGLCWLYPRAQAYLGKAISQHITIV